MPNQKNSRNQQPQEKQAPKQAPQGKRQPGRTQDDQNQPLNPSRREDFEGEDTREGAGSAKNKRR